MYVPSLLTSDSLRILRHSGDVTPRLAIHHAGYQWALRISDYCACPMSAESSLMSNQSYSL